MGSKQGAHSVWTLWIGLAEQAHYCQARLLFQCHPKPLLNEYVIQRAPGVSNYSTTLTTNCSIAISDLFKQLNLVCLIWVHKNSIQTLL